MADNERIVSEFDDKEYYLQDAPAQASRTFFTPGKAAPSTVNQSRQLEQNWPKEFPVKTGIAAVDDAGLEHGLEHIRVMKTGRSVICDQTIPVPVVLGTHVRSETGSGYSGTYTFTDTATQNNDGEQERRTGSDGIYI